MRNRMICNVIILSKASRPSYFVDGMLYNVPINNFGTTYEVTVVNALNWLISDADRSKLLCANEQFYLLHPTSPVTWRAEKMQTFLNPAAVKFWKEF